jgi:hypothetical protein
MRKAFVEQVALPEPRFRDGLGIRYVRTDGTDDPVEVLRPLWDVGMMQNAIRQRVSRLASFRQARFVPVRAAEVPRDDASTIEVVSDFVSGHRLSLYLEASQAGAVSIETSTAIYILRELLGALALLHESRGVTHGAVGPERIVITPKGRAVVADYVLGPAIERLEFTRPRLWREFRIPMPAGKGLPKLDDKADVLQVGVTALGLLLGRPIELADYPERLESLLATLAQSQKSAGRKPLPAALIGWLKRALFKDPNGKFANVSDARLSLEAVLSKQDAATGGATALKTLADAFGRHAGALEAKAAAAAAEAARNAALVAQVETQAALQELAAAEAAAAPLTDLVPAFEITAGNPAASPGAATASTASAQAIEPDDPVGWRVPEPPPEEETLPTSPLLRIEEPAVEPAAEAFVEEVLDLTGIAESEDPAVIRATAAPVAEAVPATAEAAALQPAAADLSPAGGEVEIIVDLRELDAVDVPADAAQASGPEVEAEPAVLQVVQEAETAVVVPPPAVFELPETVAEPPAAAPPLLQVVEGAGPAVASPLAEALEQPVALMEAEVPVAPVEEVLAALEGARAPLAPVRPDELPEWRLLADPVGAVAPTIDVEVPTETLEELVEAFAVSTVAEAPPPAAPAYVVGPLTAAYEAQAAAIESTVADPVPTLVEPEAPASLVETPTVEMTSALAESGAPAIAMEPPSVMVNAPEPFLEERSPRQPPPATPSHDDAVSGAAASSVLDEILDLQESQVAAQAAAELVPDAPPSRPDVGAWSFVEELLHHDARFETRGAVEDDGPRAVAEAPPPRVIEPGADRLAESGTAPSGPLSAFLAGVAAVEASQAIDEASQTREAAARGAERTAPAADESVPAVGEAAPELPPDWFIEVGPQPAAPAHVESLEPEPAREPLFRLQEKPLSRRHSLVPPIAPPAPVFYEAPAEPTPQAPPASPGAELPEFEEDLSGPVFPRVAPSVRRVRAEARRRRVARIGSSIGHGIQAVAAGCVSALAALASGIGAAFSLSGRAVATALRAVLSGSVAVIAATGRGIGGAVRGLAQGIAAVAGGTARAGAAAARALGALTRAVGAGGLRLARAIVQASGAVAGALAGGTARGLRTVASAVAASAGLTAKALAAALRAGGHGASAAARGLVSMLANLGRAGSAAVSGTARGLAAVVRGMGRIVGRAANQAASTASATGSVAGRGAVATGKGVGRAATGLPQKLYFLLSDVADRLPRPLFRPWYLAAALLVIVAVAGVPYAKALLFTPRPAMGTIRVESPRPDEMVTIDGVPRGRVPVTAPATAGRHRVEIGSAGQLRAHAVEVAAGRETLLQAAGPELVAAGSVRVTTDPPGADVFLDGVLHGTAPLTVENVSEGTHTLLIRDKSGSVRQTVRVNANEAVDATVQIRPGWLAVFAPVKLAVLENGRPIGSTEGGRILVSPGPHTFEVASQSLGFRETRQVEIRPGVVVAVTIQLPPATIEIVAPAEAEILVDGQPVGQAPLGPIEVAVGTREIVMRHPTLGERRQVVSVNYHTPVRVVFE